MIAVDHDRADADALDRIARLDETGQQTMVEILVKMAGGPHDDGRQTAVGNGLTGSDQRSLFAVPFDPAVRFQIVQRSTDRVPPDLKLHGKFAFPG